MTQLLNSFSNQDLRELEVALQKLKKLVVEEEGCFTITVEGKEMSAELYKDVAYRWIGLNYNQLHIEAARYKGIMSLARRYEFQSEKTCPIITIWGFDRSCKGHLIYQNKPTVPEPSSGGWKDWAETIVKPEIISTAFLFTKNTHVEGVFSMDELRQVFRSKTKKY